MPLTAEEKNQIAQGSALTASVAISATTTGLLGGALGTGGLGIIFAPLILGLQQEFGRVHAPAIDPISILNVTRSLRRRGLEPRISQDPFFGDTIISARDQDFFLPEIIRGLAERRIRAQTDFSSIFRQREAVGAELARTAEARGFRTSIDPDLRGGVFRATAESPLEFIEGDFLNAPR